MPGSATMRLLLLLSLSVSLVALAAAHGLMTDPRQRGSQNCVRNIPNRVMSTSVPRDFCPHCQNAGGVSRVRNNGPHTWRPYQPLTQDVRGGFGECGDPYGNNDHRKFGKFGGGGPVAVWTEGDYVNFEFDATANHGGFLEFYICDVGRNEGKDINFGSFARDCKYLERVPHGDCESGHDKECGPIDHGHKGRWVLPCRWRQGDQGDQMFGGSNGKMKYKLPDGFVAEHAVVQMYWFVANSCQHPDGFMEAYNYPQAWGQCGGDGGSRGGKPLHHQSCTEGGKFPEEFWNCADVQVKSKYGGFVGGDSDSGHASDGEHYNVKSWSSGGGRGGMKHSPHSMSSGRKTFFAIGGKRDHHIHEDGKCAPTGGYCTPGQTRCCNPADGCNPGPNKCQRSYKSNGGGIVQDGNCKKPGQQANTYDRCCVEGAKPYEQNGVHKC